jgi:hypothetical protein
MLIRMRRWDEAETQLKEAVRIDPLSVMGYDRLGMVYRLKGDEEKSQEHYKIASELDNTTPTDESPLEYATRLIERDGRLPPNLARLANAYIQSGEEEKADKILNELRRLYETRDFGNIALFISRIYYLLDEIEQSFDWLDKAYEKRDPLLISINTNSTLLQYQSHPRIKAIREKMGLN